MLKRVKLTFNMILPTFKASLFLLIFMWGGQKCDCKIGDIYPEEEQLMDHLFRNYSKTVRPSVDPGETVNMKFGIAYVQLIELDDREMMLVSSVWIRQSWYNHLLRWDPEEFNGVKSLTVSPSLVWLPDVVLYNNAQKGLGAETMYKFKTKVIIKYDGTNTWYAPTIIRSGCDVNIALFPFDDQRCELKFGSWTYHGGELNLTRDRTEADTAFYLPSTDFHLVSAKSERKETEYTCCPGIIYPNIIYTLHLRRQPGFYLFNVIIPSLVLTCLSIITFGSPPIEGERISLAIEAFLSLTFLCMMVSDSIPVNSDVTPIITSFLGFCRTAISAAVMCNLIALNISGSRPVPRWLKFVAFKIIGPCVGYFHSEDESAKENHEENAEISCEGRNRSSRLRSALTKPLQCGNKMIKSGRRLHERARSALMEYMDSCDSSMCEATGEESIHMRRYPVPAGVNETAYKRTTNGLRDLVRRAGNEADEVLARDFWRCVAQTYDRLCWVALGFSFFFLTACFLMKGYGHVLEVEKEAEMHAQHH